MSRRALAISPIVRSARWLGLLLVLLLPLACGPASPARGPEQGASCQAGGLKSCESALVTAGSDELPALLASYDLALERDGAPPRVWAGIWKVLSKSNQRPVVVHDGGHGELAARLDVDVAVLPAAATPRSLEPAELLVALGDETNRRHIIYLTGSAPSIRALQLFPGDLLAPHALALPPIVRSGASPERLRADVELAKAIHQVLTAANRFDYGAAALGAERLESLIETSPLEAEPTLRARLTVQLLNRSAIALESPEEDQEEGAEEEDGPQVAVPATGSLMAQLIRVRLADDPRERWRQTRASIAPHLSAHRVALLDESYRPEDTCPKSLVPPMDDVGDLMFAHRLGSVLETKPVVKAETAPAGSAATPRPGPSTDAESAAAAAPAVTEGMLHLDQWLPLYEAMLRMVEQTGTMWAFGESVLLQRGELHGLSAVGTHTYRTASELALKHVTALHKLAQSHPGRFRPMAVLPLVYQPGTLSDRRVRAAVIELAQRSVALKLEHATDVKGVFNAGLAALMAAMSLPPDIQLAQFAALQKALSAKLEGPVGQQTGWGAAGLHAADGAIGLVTGNPAKLRTVAPRVARSLGDATSLPYAPLGRLATSAAHYAALVGTDRLDASVANPAMFSAERRAAHDALREAIAGLADDGPESPPERELLRQTAAFADELIASVAAAITQGDDAENVCEDDSGARRDPKLRNAFDRLARKRKQLLNQRAFRTGESTWLRRVRLVITVLSDALDIADPKGKTTKFTLAQGHVERVLRDAVAGWNEPAWADALAGGYMLVRSAVGDEQTDPQRVAANVARVVRALQALFVDDASDSSTPSALFSALTKASASADLAKASDELGLLLVSSADKAYADGAGDQGDLFLFIALGVSVAREQSLPERALALARQYRRPVTLPLLMRAHRDDELSDPAPLATAMREARKGHCSPPSPESVIALIEAVHEFKHGDRNKALQRLDGWLEQRTREGLVVPRLTFSYEETTATKVFKLEGSISHGLEYLLNSGSLQVGLGMRSAGEPRGEMKVTFADPNSGTSKEEAARLYAYVAALTGVYHWVQGDKASASGAARRAIPAWAIGVRLGDTVVGSGNKSAEWARDARGVLLVAGQLAAESGQAFLAGDLWTLARGALGAQADDEAIDEALDPLPRQLRSIPELEPVVERARRSVQVMASRFACTKRKVDPKDFATSDCQGYPVALAYRIADALEAMPHLKRGAEVGQPQCEPWRALDTFLSAAAQRRYEPDAFTKAVVSLHANGNPYDAATLLTRQRHQKHCVPALVSQARTMARRQDLGADLRADLLSVAANCTGSQSIDTKLTDDLLLLDELTQSLAVPARNLEVLLFATRMGLQSGRFEPLFRLTDRPDFVQRWIQFGPELATAALLIHHAARVASGRPMDPMRTLPFYRLLCTTFPPKQRGPMCNAIGLLRSGEASDEKKRAARASLTTLVAQPPGQPAGR